jgi:uncharacterized protein YkwD
VSMFTFAAMLAIVAFAATPTAHAAPDGGTAQLKAATNAYRTANRLPAVKSRSQLNQAASSYARFLAQKNLEGHTADGKTVERRIAEAGYKQCLSAENVHSQWAQGKNPGYRAAAAAALAWWKQSAGHNANLLHKGAEDFGVAIAYVKHGDKHVYKSVMVLAAPCS